MSREAGMVSPEQTSPARTARTESQEGERGRYGCPVRCRPVLLLWA